MNPLLRHPSIAVALAAIAILAARQVSNWTAPNGPAWLDQAIFKGALIVLSLVGMQVAGLNRKQAGYQMPLVPWRMRATLLGLGAGAAATLTILASGSAPNPVMRGMSLGAAVVWVFLFSSISEEILCRGWLQSSIQGPGRVVISALFFGAMHLLLFLRGAPVSTVLILVFWTTVLGFVAAVLRERTASLLPPTVAHIAFNFGGAIGGLLYVIAYRLTTGTLRAIPR